MTLALVLIAVLSLASAALVAVSEYQQRHHPVSTGDGPLRPNHHRATVLIGGR
jgi:hypothetical protein